MIVFRIIQAIPGGVIPVVALSMLYRIVPREKIGAAMGHVRARDHRRPGRRPDARRLPRGVRRLAADLLHQRADRHPRRDRGAGAAAARSGGPPGSRFDLLGFLAIATGLFSLLLALSEGEAWGWTSYPVLILFTFGTLCLALFVVIELEVDHPLLDVRVFRFWPFTNSLILIAVLSVGLFGVLFYIPLYLQQSQGLGAFDSGPPAAPAGASVMAV